MDNINYEKINEFLKLENLGKHISELLRFYCNKYPSAVPSLLSNIATLSAIQVEDERQKSSRRTMGIEQMIHMMFGLSPNLTDEQFVVDSWQAVKEYYFGGDAYYASYAGQQFFNKFVKALKASPKLIDSTWAIEIAECNDYLKLVLEKNP